MRLADPAIDPPPTSGTRTPVPLVRRGRPRRGSSSSFDALDEAILAALQMDGRASLRRVAKVVGASVTTVSGRVRALERLGVLQGFVPLVSVQGLAAVGRSPHCTVLYIVPSVQGRDALERLARDIAKEAGICYLFQLAGSPELLALASSPSLEGAQELIRSVSRIPGVTRVRPTPIARIHKERPHHPVGLPENGAAGRLLPALGP